MTQASNTSPMVQLMEQLAPVEGYNLSALDDIRFLRSNRPLTRTPVLYDPGIVILCQGRKRGYLGDDVYVYDAQHYLVVSVPVPFTMETDATEAAHEANMSVPNFHLHFRSVTDSTPMQYLKSTRLHQARLLMLRNAMSASAAAFSVGYESASQFSREFKRFFGRAPQAEIEWMKATYALPAPATPSVYVSSH